MLPNTSRCTGESSCHWSVVEVMPEMTVTTANPTPIARATYVGLMRRDVDAAGVLSGLLTGAPFGLRAVSNRPFGPSRALCLWFARCAHSRARTYPTRTGRAESRDRRGEGGDRRLPDGHFTRTDRRSTAGGPMDPRRTRQP